ncbi:MAG: hypothetical protein ACNYWM_12195 [Methanosarcinales archaeon]
MKRNSEEADLIKQISPIAWQNVNLLGRFEFQRQQSVINIDEMISLLEQKIVWQQPKVTEEVLVHPCANLPTIKQPELCPCKSI